MTQSLTGSWMKEITAGYAPPASEETGIRYPCAPTSLEVVDRVLDVLASFETHLPATMVEPGGQDLPSEAILVRKA